MADNLGRQITFGGVADNFGGEETIMRVLEQKNKKQNRANYFDWG
jgi:hypothetical protein